MIIRKTEKVVQKRDIFHKLESEHFVTTWWFLFIPIVRFYRLTRAA